MEVAFGGKKEEQGKNSEDSADEVVGRKGGLESQRKPYQTLQALSVARELSPRERISHQMGPQPYYSTTLHAIWGAS
jgi:hypothetical protein